MGKAGFQKPSNRTIGITKSLQLDIMGFDAILILAADNLMFQGEPFAEEDYCDTIPSVQQTMDSYDPAVTGYVWDDKNPRLFRPGTNYFRVILRGAHLLAHTWASRQM